MLVTSIFSFSHNVFYHSQTKFKFFSHLYLVVCKCSQFGSVQNLSFGKKLKHNLTRDVFALCLKNSIQRKTAKILQPEVPVLCVKLINAQAPRVQTNNFTIHRNVWLLVFLFSHIFEIFPGLKYSE